MSNITLSWDELGKLTDDQVAMAGWNKNIPAIGDTKELSFTIDGEPVNAVMQLVGINHDRLSYGKGLAHFSFLCKDIYIKYVMNKPLWRFGDLKFGGWCSSNLYSFIYKVIEPSLPTYLRDSIKPVKKESDSERGREPCVTHNTLWIPSYDVVCGNKSPNSFYVQGNQYEAFLDYSNRKKEYGGIPTSWHLRSSGVYDKEYYYVEHSGQIKCGLADEQRGIVFGFCI